MEIILSVLVVALLGVLFYMFRQNRILRQSKIEPAKPDITSDIVRFRNIGELSVFKVDTKEIVTCEDEAVRGIWQKIFGWAVTKKQISLIFDFEVSFVYDLRSKDFSIEALEDGSYKVNMPKCSYRYSIRDMKIYDEKNAKLMPYILPDSLNGVLGLNFSANDKNKLIENAKEEVKRVSLKFDDELQRKVHKSACDTIESIARSFGANHVSFVFHDKKEIENEKDSAAIIGSKEYIELLAQ